MKNGKMPSNWTINPADRIAVYKAKHGQLKLGPRGFLSNYPPDVIAVINGHPITKSDIIATKQRRVARQLAAKRRVGAVKRAAFVWVFYVGGVSLMGWHVYVVTINRSWWLRHHYNEWLIPEIMTLWPCGCLPGMWNLHNWYPRFERRYHRIRRLSRSGRQGMVRCWAWVEDGQVRRLEHTR